ncbi:MAG: isochorismatase family protein [Rhodocyclaceae bacterium]|nr:isochorismatase family protein [Rhodocyclaceae bacterium]
MDASVTSIGPGDALLVIDVQNDFLPGGSLAVRDGDAVIAPLNRVLALFAQHRLPVFATRDWHPPDHCSFTAQGGPWPVHCVAGTKGAGFPAALHLSTSTTVVSKAVAAERDAYSGFERTELAELLRMQGVRRLFVGGLATDYCVLATVRDACAAGFAVVVLTDAVRAVELHAGDGERALQGMRDLGALFGQSVELSK